MMRRFTIEEEQALLGLLVDDMRWHKLPVRPGASPHASLARLGCLQTIQHGIVTRGRLTATGRYFAVLLRESGLVIADKPGTIRERMAGPLRPLPRY